ncbi:KTSC domain-containing protein [Flavobacterium sp.]|uniref:KTSC domain-containing protein n=1 Tax=Flavobacterium sp. TaxID=239 RepID=UPI002627D265|nr:KTSC domain-containing protein [Flavobacterium sp.]
MKKIVAYRALLEVDKNVTLKELKTIYRNAMKDAHPDKFQGDDEGLKVAEERSKQIIEAYHHLVSINPETREVQMPEFQETVAKQTLIDYDFVDGRLVVKFDNGIKYEFISVPKATYVKMVNADSPARFAKRHIFPSFVWRKVSNED